MLLLKLGYRNLWRNRRRTLLTMSAMALSTALLILTLGIYDGMLWDMIEGATELYHGHVKIAAKGYLDNEQIFNTIPEDGVREEVLKDPMVVGAAGRVRGFALLSAGEGEKGKSQPAELFGIDPEEEHTVTSLDKHVSEGHFLSGSSTKEIVLGRGLAILLDAGLGDEVVAMGQGADGSIAAELFTVAGIIDTNDQVRDTMLAVAGRKTLQSMFVLDGRLHEVSVKLTRSLEARRWAEKEQVVLADYDVSPWNSFLPQIGQIIDVWGTMKFIFAVIFYFAVILVSANTMYMSLLERLREFGIMAAIGLKQRRLSRLVLLEGFMMSALAGLVGGLVGIAGSFYLKNHYIDLSAFISEIAYAETVLQPRLRTYPAAGNMLMPIAMITLLGVAVASFPARRLKRHKPVDVLREV